VDGKEEQEAFTDTQAGKISRRNRKRPATRTFASLAFGLA
jgi:hypothetical protein